MMARLIAGATTLALGTLALGGAAVAQTQTSSVSVASGKETRLSTHGVFKKDCTPGPLPEIKITTPPKNGAFVVKTATLKTSATSACANKEGPAQIVYYQAKEGFSGSDTLTYQIKAAGPAQTHTVNVTVTK